MRSYGSSCAEDALRAATCAALLAFAPAALGQLQKCVDAAGKTSYQEGACPDNSASSTLKAPAAQAPDGPTWPKQVTPALCFMLSQSLFTVRTRPNAIKATTAEIANGQSQFRLTCAPLGYRDPYSESDNVHNLQLARKRADEAKAEAKAERERERAARKAAAGK